MIGEDELGRLVTVRNAVWPHDPGTAADYVDRRNQSTDMVWLVATEGGDDAGAAIGIHGWRRSGSCQATSVAPLEIEGFA